MVCSSILYVPSQHDLGAIREGPHYCNQLHYCGHFYIADYTDSSSTAVQIVRFTLQCYQCCIPAVLDFVAYFSLWTVLLIPHVPTIDPVLFYIMHCVFCNSHFVCHSCLLPLDLQAVKVWVKFCSSVQCLEKKLPRSSWAELIHTNIHPPPPPPSRTATTVIKTNLARFQPNGLYSSFFFFIHP